MYCCVRYAIAVPWTFTGKLDIQWTTEIVPGASWDIHGPTTTVPWPFTQRSLQGQLRLVTFHGSSMGRPGSFMLQPIRAPSHTHHGTEVSANQHAALVWPNVTPFWQEVGCPEAVRNRKITTMICCLSQSECVPLLFGTGSWSSLRHHGAEVLLSFAVFSQIIKQFVLHFEDASKL